MNEKFIEDAKSLVDYAERLVAALEAQNMGEIQQAIAGLNVRHWMVCSNYDHLPEED